MLPQMKIGENRLKDTVIMDLLKLKEGKVLYFWFFLFHEGLGQDSVQVSSHGAILCVIKFPMNPQVRLILFILIQNLRRHCY